MKRDERAGCAAIGIGIIVLIVLAWLAIYWGKFALEQLQEILERIG